MKSRSIMGSQITEECWSIQFKGKEACLGCEFRNTDECGGKNIIKTGKNKKGFPIPLGKEHDFR